MKIIFLDIDGVLYSDRAARFVKNHDPGQILFDASAMTNLAGIIRETDASIVISSSWRIHRNTSSPLWAALLRNLSDYGLDRRIIGTTAFPDTIGLPLPRWQEIKQWLIENKNTPIEAYVILDDEYDMGELNGCFVRCSGSVGITECNCIEAIRILNMSHAIAPVLSYKQDENRKGF